MTISKTRKLKFTDLLRAFLLQRDGVAAVEFALVVPIMATMFIGAVEMCQAITAWRHVQQVAYSISDLVARVCGVQDVGTGTSSGCSSPNALQVLSDDMDMVSYLLAPYTASTATITVTVVVSSTTSTNTKIFWQCIYQGSSPNTVTCNGGSNSCYSSAGTPWPSITLAPGTVSGGNAVVLGNISYGYKPPLFNVFMKSAYTGGSSGGTYTMATTAYQSPRTSAAPSLRFSGSGTTCSPPPASF